MKKSLIALAVLAATGAASAQSSLNLYGVADIWLGKTKNADAQFGSGGLAGSRIGFKGTEDLGGGLKAHFVLEQGVNLTNGTAAGFNRQANVGVSGQFGTVKIGRVYTAFDDINGAANSGFDSDLSATAGTWVGYTGNPTGQIYYASPVFNGISGAVSLTPQGNKSATNPDVTSLHLKYSNGPIYAGVAYQDEAPTTGSSVKYFLVNGSYDLGMVVLKASYRNVDNTNASNTLYNIFSNRKADEFQVGADYPVNSQLTVSVGYASSKLKGVDTRLGANPTSGSIQNAEGYGVAAGYALSKRTTVYGGLRANKVNGTSDSLVAAGVSHAF
ncbi:MAG: hypothetical protein RLZZ352_1432 [Pseudomonadota bacterium]|jgi:predicted porin